MSLEMGGAGGGIGASLGVSASWWDEEERKRREKLGIAGAPVASSQTSAGDYKPLVDRPGQEVREYTDAQKLKLLASTGGPKQPSAIEEWYQVESRVGTDLLKDRLSSVASIWKAYLPTLPSADGVWQLVKSSYTLEEIEEMCRQASLAGDSGSDAAVDLRRAMSEIPMKQNNLNPSDPYSYLSVMKMRGYQPAGQSTIEKIGDKLADFFGLIRNEDGTVNWGWTGVTGDVLRFWEHPNEVAAAAGTVMTFGAGAGVFTAPTMLGTTIGGMSTGAALAPTSQVAGAMGRFATSGAAGLLKTGAVMKAGGDVVSEADARIGADVSAQESAQKAMQRDSARYNVFVNQIYNEMVGYCRKLDEESAIGVQNSLKEDVHDEFGNFIGGGYGKDLEANGAWTWEWDEALRQAVTDQVGRNIERQRRMIESGAAESYYTVDGNMNTDQWRKAEALQLRLDITRRLRKDEDPLWSAQVDMSTIPQSDAELQAYVNRLKSEGVAQAPLKALIALVGAFGGGYNAILSTVEHTVKRENDPTFQELRTELIEYARKSGKFSDIELALLSDRYAFMDDELANGKLKDDAEAQDIARRMKQRSAQIIASGFEPSTVGMFGHALGFPYQSVEDAKDDLAELDLALNIARDAFIAVKSAPAIKALKKGKAIGSTVEEFKGSEAANLKAQEVSKHIKDGQPGLAQDTIRGSDSPAIVKTLTDAYNGSNARGGFWRNLAHEIVHDAEAGDWKAVASKLEGGGINAGQVQTAVGKAQAAFDPAKTAGENVKSMGRSLASEQRANNTFLDLDRTVIDHLAGAYSSGMSVFPYFRAPQLPGGGLFAESTRSWMKMVEGIENPALKRFLEKQTLKFIRNPLEAQEYFAQDSSARVFEAAYAASNGDISFAMKMRNKWVMSRSQAQMDGVCDIIRMEANRNFKLKHPYDPREMALGVNPLTGETLGTLADTGQMKYKGMFRDARETIWAPKNLDALTGSERIFAKVIGNPWRKFGRGMKKLNDPLRRWTVGFPLLFTKHAIVDSTRTLIEAGSTAFFDALRKSKSFEASLAELSPEIANSVRANLHKSKVSEQHYNVGGHHVGHGDGGIPYDFVSRKIYELDSNMQLKPVNMAEGVEALRRVAIGRVFQEYARGGLQAVADWLAFTKEGKQFLHRSGNITITKEYLKQMGVQATGPQLYQAAVADYLQRVGTGYLEALDLSAPNVSAGLKEMALNNVPLTQKNIKSLVERVNANGVTENPFVSIPPETAAPFVQEFMTNAAYRTAMFMTPNKWNREVLYKASFDRFYKEMKKQGFEPDTSAKVAMDLAELETARVHFDLANGLYFETQNRWFAWFGTKHRLYNSYLLKMASERPSIAGAAQTLIDYLEDKNNENPNGSEWDKFNFRIPVGWLTGHEGDEWVGNPATIVWLAEYPIESSTAQVAKIAGATAVNTIAGKEVLHQDVGDYGLSSGRWDGIVLTTATMVAAFTAYRTADQESKDNNDWLVGVLDSPWLPDRVRKSIAKGMSLAQFDAISRGEEITPADAFWKSGISAMLYEYIQLGKPISGRLRTHVEGEANRLMKEFDNVPYEDRPEWLLKNPQASALFGMYSTNPATRMIVDQGWKLVQQATQKRKAALDQALADGTIFDAKVVSAINRDFDLQIERLTNPEWRDPKTGEPAPEYNEHFAKVWSESGYEKFTREEGINILYPWVDARAINAQGYIPSQVDQEAYLASLKEAYDAEVAERGWSSLGSSSPVLFWLKEKMIVDPMRRYTKNAADGDERWSSRKEETIADTLARGEGGPSRAMAYLNEVHLRYKMKALAAGTDSRAKSGVSMSDPLFSKMTTEDKTDAGWNSDRSAEYIWQRWALQKAAQQVWMNQNGISPSSKKGLQIAQQLHEWATKEGENNEYFKKEYDFAQKPLHERLRDIGIGTTGKKTDQGWQELFAIVTSYHADLSRVNGKGVGPQAQAAAPVTKFYLEQIIELKRKEPEWWREFSQMYTPSNFGFYWRLEDGRDQELFGGEAQLPYDETYDYEVT